MFGRRHVCITDPEARAMWQDYRALLREGNPDGLSFTEYVSRRVNALRPIIAVPQQATSASPWYVAQCGHQHPWGEPCGSWTEA